MVELSGDFHIAQISMVVYNVTCTSDSICIYTLWKTLLEAHGSIVANTRILMIAIQICALRTQILQLSYSYICKDYSLKNNLYDILTLYKNTQRKIFKWKMSAQVEISLRLLLNSSLYKYTYIHIY